MMCEGLRIDPPPEEMGDEPLFRVVYVIDVIAGNVREAAEYTHRIMTDPDSLRPVLQVVDSKGDSAQVDLSESDGDPDERERAPNYEAAAQYLADQGERIFTGPMKGGLWNARCMDACLMSKEQGDKVAYEFLLKFGDRYASGLPSDQQRQWQTIKNEAANRLKGDPESTAETRKQAVTDLFTKTTVGFVVQTFRKNSQGRYICTHQEFIAGDQCDYEDVHGNPIEPQEHEYQPYNMALRAQTPNETVQAAMLTSAYDAIEEVLESLDVGGEQSRQFAEEIQTLRQVIGHPEAVDGVLDEISRRRWLVQKLLRLAMEAGGLTVSLPTMPVMQWLDGTAADAKVDVCFEDHDLSALLQFLADVGISCGD
jgi:hypothetical protein